MTFRFAIIGAGVISSRHAEALQAFPGQAERHRTDAAQPDALVHQYRGFLAALRGEGEVRVGLEENRQAVALITGLYEAARTGRLVRLDT